MSAYLCEPRHIGALAAYVAAKNDARSSLEWLLGPALLEAAGGSLAESVAAVLARANVKSVATRYPNDAEGERPGGMEGETDADYIAQCSEAAQRYPTEATPVQVIMAVNCLDYQSCEYDEWKGSTARKILNLVVSEAHAELPGWDAAEWGWPEPQPVRVVR